MFLRPHHLQAAQRHLAQLQHTADQWDHPFSWGLRIFDLDRDALTNHRLAVRSLRARMRDGTLISLPEDGELPVLDLKAALPGEGAVTVFLGVPVLHLGRPNLAGARLGEGRYVLDTLDLEDENTGLHPQPIQVRRLNFQLLLSTQDHAGYEVIPLVSLEKSAGADPAPQVHVPYIPPLLACDAWSPLQVDLLQSVFDRIGRKIDRLAEQVTSRGITLESHAQGDALIIAQLRASTRPTPCSTSSPSRRASIRSRPTTSCAGWSASWRSSATRAGRPTCRATTTTTSAAASTPSRSISISCSTASSSRPTNSGRSRAPGCGCRWRWSRNGSIRTTKCM